MKCRKPASALKRVACTAIAWTFLLQTVSPAYAVSPGAYTGFVSQLPSVYATPPDVNVMFTMDDSGSMQWETIPDSFDSMSSNMWNRDWNRDDSSGMRQTFRLVDSDLIWRYYRSPAGNPIYYNPEVSYKPWPFAGDDTKTYPPANPAHACYSLDLPASPMPAAVPAPAPGVYLDCGTLPWKDLKTRVVTNPPDNAAQDDQRAGFWPATYFKYVGPADQLVPNGRATNTTTNPGNVTANFRKVEIRPGVTYAKGANRTDCSATGCTYEQEIQNFANWFTYYRTRRLMAKGGVAAAFAKQSTNLRVGFASINSPNVIRIGVRQFSGANRVNFYTDMYPLATNGGTPLLNAADRVGEYFTHTDNNNPWAFEPASGVKTPEYTCRRSFHILTTDGFWNGNSYPATSAADNTTFSGAPPAKADGTRPYVYSNTLPPDNAPDPLTGRFMIDPFKDNVSSTNARRSLADIAAYYWKTDLRDLENRVVPSARDPAYWQHLTTFTVGLGINGTGTVKRLSDNATVVPAAFAASAGDATQANKPWLASQAIRDALVSTRTALVWPQPVDNDATTGDDLIHASMVGRGRYFSATNPTDLSNGLASALSEAADQPFDQASVAADAPQVRAGGKVYQATFSPSRWYGRLYAFTQNVSTGLVNNKPTDSSQTNPDQAWEASNKMLPPDERRIFTSSGTAGSATPFRWSSSSSGGGRLTDAQKALLDNDANLLDYLRGDGRLEVARGGSFRDRTRYTVGGVTGGVLGDVVNGSPLKGPDAGGGYDRLLAGSPGQAQYTTYRSGSRLDNLRNTIFLGANDGMLHAFDIADGSERFAYVPNAVYNVPRSTAGGLAEPKLKMLADPTYTHRFTVDGPPNVSDAFIGGRWRTVLVASNGAGARGLFAFDVTNPAHVAAASEPAFGTDNFLWEFTEADHEDMGFVLGYPHVARMRNGRWGVIFGNGFDSRNGQAKLFILDLETRTVMKEFAVGTAGENGLGQPNFVLDSNREVIAIYAGDLKGNLWKFDVSDASLSATSVWNVAFSGNPLFTAVNGSNVAQPITVMPEITAHPNGGAIVSFGTGKFFESSDTAATLPPNVNLTTQSIYGVWDKPGAGAITMSGASRASVLQAQGDASTQPTNPGYQATTGVAPNWGTSRGWFYDLATGGERVNLPPQQVRSTLFVVANKPINDPCANGGQSRIFAFDPITGLPPSFPVFDVNADGRFDPPTETGINVKRNVTGILTQPIFQLPSQASFSLTNGVTLSPFELFDRGQSTAARAGGVELSRSFGSTPAGNIPNPCALLLTAAQSDTSLMSQYIQTCTPSTLKGRISWRQLK